MCMNYWVLLAVAGFGALGGFANVFAGDTGFHLPGTNDGIWRPGFLGVIVIGAIAALASWGSLKSGTLFGGSASTLVFSTGDLANAIIIGFGGAKWLKSESDKTILRKAAVVAAGKGADAASAAQIATGTPLEALRVARNMQ